MKYFGGSGECWGEMAINRVTAAGCMLAVGGLALVLLGTMLGTLLAVYACLCLALVTGLALAQRPL